MMGISWEWWRLIGWVFLGIEGVTFTMGSVWVEDWPWEFTVGGIVAGVLCITGLSVEVWLDERKNKQSW